MLDAMSWNAVDTILIPNILFTSEACATSTSEVMNAAACMIASSKKKYRAFNQKLVKRSLVELVNNNNFKL